jgi:hypothetical protein
MAGIPKVKITFDADFDELKKGVKGAQNEVESFSDRVSDFGKKAAIAFAAAGVAAVAFGVSAVKAAVEDEAAQLKLAETIKATTSATAAQIAGVEDYITKTSIAVGVTDDQLRPAFARLVRSTKDTEEAQSLLNLALDLSAATSKPVEAVTNALAKAYDGNYAALGKLGLGLDANLLKSKDNEAIIKSLEQTYGKFAEGAAETTAKKFERIKIATSEAKEAIGAALLPVVQKFADYLLITVVPNLESFINGLTGKGSLTEATDNATQSAYQFGQQVKRVLTTIINFKEELLIVASVIAGIFVVSKIAASVTATIALIKTLIAAYNLLKASAIVTGVAAAFALNPLLGVGAVGLAAAVLAGATALATKDDFQMPSTGSIPFASGFAPAAAGGGGGGSVGATGGSGTGSIPSVPRTSVNAGVSAAAAGAAMSNQYFGGAINTGSSNYGGLGGAGMAGGGGAPVINVTVNGAIDSEGTARTIVNTLNDSFYRGTGGASGFRIEK